jgi:ankyrin repeat protein
MIACESGDKKALAVAIASSENINFVFSETGETPLTACLKFRKYELIETLIYKWHADVKLPNKDGQTPLHVICLADEEKLLSSRGLFGIGKGQAMATILRNRPDINAQDSRGRTPLHYAGICGERTYIKQLFSELANTDIRDADGLTAEELMISMAKADIERLFASGFDGFRR